MAGCYFHSRLATRNAATVVGGFRDLRGSDSATCGAVAHNRDKLKFVNKLPLTLAYFHPGPLMRDFSAIRTAAGVAKCMDSRLRCVSLTGFEFTTAVSCPLSTVEVPGGASGLLALLAADSVG